MLDHIQESILHSWRIRLAWQIRRYRKARGTWPLRSSIDAAKVGIAQATAAYVRPRWEN